MGGISVRHAKATAMLDWENGSEDNPSWCACAQGEVLSGLCFSYKRV